MALFDRIPGVDDANNFNSNIRKAIANSTAAEINTADTNMRTEVDKRVAASTDFLKKTVAALTYITPAGVDSKVLVEKFRVDGVLEDLGELEAEINDVRDDSGYRLVRRTVTGDTTIDVKDGDVWEITATAASQISLNPQRDGMSCAIFPSGQSITVESRPVPTAHVCVKLTDAWYIGKMSEMETVAITAPVPVFSDSSGTYVLTKMVGVRYRVGSAVKAPGVHVVDVPASVTITAEALSGFSLVGTTSWTHAFPALPVQPIAPWDLPGMKDWFDATDPTKLVMRSDNTAQVLSVRSRLSTKVATQNAGLILGTQNDKTLFQSVSPSTSGLGVNYGNFTSTENTDMRGGFTWFGLARWDAEPNTTNFNFNVSHPHPSNVNLAGSSAGISINSGTGGINGQFGSPPPTKNILRGQMVAIVTVTTSTGRKLYLDGDLVGSVDSAIEIPYLGSVGIGRGGMSVAGMGVSTKTDYTLNQIKAFAVWAKQTWSAR